MVSPRNFTAIAFLTEGQDVIIAQVLLGKISSLSTDQWAQALSNTLRRAPTRPLAGRGLLSRVLAPQPLPEIVYRGGQTRVCRAVSVVRVVTRR